MGTEILLYGTLAYILLGIIGCMMSTLCYSFRKITKDSREYFLILLFNSICYVAWLLVSFFTWILWICIWLHQVFFILFLVASTCCTNYCKMSVFIIIFIFLVIYLG